MSRSSSQYARKMVVTKEDCIVEPPISYAFESNRCELIVMERGPLNELLGEEREHICVRYETKVLNGEV